jgi:hypothetical protein
MIKEALAPERICELFDITWRSFKTIRNAAANPDEPKTPFRAALIKALFIYSIHMGHTLEEHLNFSREYMIKVDAWRKDCAQEKENASEK